MTVCLPAGGTKRGIFTEITERGEMLLREPGGAVCRFDCGDVKIDAALVDFETLKRNFNKYKSRKG